MAATAECLACADEVTEATYCLTKPDTPGCEEKAKPTLPPLDLEGPSGQGVLRFLWGVSNLILAACVGCWVSSRPNDGIDRGYVAILALLHTVEGTAFIIDATRAVNNSLSLFMAFMMLQMSFHTPCLWSRFLYLYNCDAKKSMTETWLHFLPLTVGGAVLITFFASFMPPDTLLFWQGMFFETPGILGLVAAFGFIFATCGRNNRNPSLVALSISQAVISFGVFVLHINSMGEGEATIASAWGVTRNEVTLVRMVLQWFGFALCAAISAALCENGAFNEAGTMESAWLRPEDTQHFPVPLREEGNVDETPRRWAISNDRIFSIAFVFSILAYAITFVCLQVFTDYNRQNDPVFRMYKTLHPCILLDYRPGTLFAQPLYDMQLFLVNLGMQVAICKKCLEGGFPRLAMGAIAYTVFFMCSVFFQLVFTFNPTHVSVLAHSLPFMTFQIGVGLFLYTEVLSLMWNDSLGLGGMFMKYPCFTTYVSFVIFSNIGAIFFMTQMLSNNWDIALNKVDLKSLPPLEMETHWDKVKMAISTFMAGAQEPLYVLWFWLTPRKHFCIGCNITLKASSMREEEEEEDPVAAPYGPVVSPGSMRLGFSFEVDKLLRLSMTLLLIIIGLAGHINWHNLPGGKDMPWRESSRTLPGSAVLACGWVVVVFLLSTFTIMDIYCTWNLDIAPVLKPLVSFTAALMCFTTYLAHGGTIPGVSGYYPGPTLFKVAFYLYVCAKTLVTLSTRARRKSVHIVCELVTAVLLGFAVLQVILTNTLNAEFFCIICVVIWAHFHSNHVVVYFSLFQQEDDYGNNCPWPIVWELPPLAPDDKEMGPNAVRPSQVGSPKRFDARGQPVSPTSGYAGARVASPVRQGGFGFNNNGVPAFNVQTQGGSPPRSSSPMQSGSAFRSSSPMQSGSAFRSGSPVRVVR